jgi:putative inorganic carbon (HCO3(-)) transporter
MGKTLDKVIKFSLYLLVFLLPLFWLPFSFEAFELNKQYLLFFLVSFTLFVWLAKMVFIEREIRFKKTPLDIFVLGFLFIAVLSTIFSVDRGSSLFGFYGRFSDGLIGLLSLGIFYFLLTNNVRMDAEDSTDRSRLSVGGTLKVFSWSVFFVVLASYFSIFGIWVKLSTIIPEVFSRVMSQPIFNPVAGSMEGLTIFLAAITVLFVGLLLEFKLPVPNPRFKNIFYSLLILGSVGILIFIDYNLAWAVLLISLLAFLIFALIMRVFRENVNRLLLPVFLIVVAAAFLFLPVTKIEIPQEQILGQGTSWQADQGISWETAFRAAIAETSSHLPPQLASQVSVTEKIKSAFLGSGVGTYFYDFIKFKPVEFNQNPLWQIGFDRPSSHFAEILGTMGFLGLLSSLVLLGVFLIISWFLLRTKTLRFQLPLLMTFLALVIGQFVYYQNTSLAFAFWLMLGLGTASWQSSAGKAVKEKVISFKELPEMSLIFSAVLIILVVVILGLYYFGVSYYWADVNYYKSLALLGQERIEKLERAVQLNPRSPQYRLVLSRAFLFEFFQELQKPLEEQDLQKIQALLNRSISEAKTATDLQPNFVANWNNKGIIYREIVGLAGGAAEESIRSFERAAALEPVNPAIYTELGKLYLALADRQKAKEYFQKAQEKKPSYADAIIQEALVLEKEDILGEAITRLENLITKDPWNIEAHFQLGRLYYNVGRVDEAIRLFEAVALVVPKHSNALYSLGLAYVAKDRIQEAILAFERVLELNPGNQDVIQKLEILKRQGEPEEQEEQEEQVGPEELTPPIEP